ncbi:hypothetical protein RQP46_010905 [Phenoliferia psychrophenolica]
MSNSIRTAAEEPRLTRSESNSSVGPSDRIGGTNRRRREGLQLTWGSVYFAESAAFEFLKAEDIGEGTSNVAAAPAKTIVPAAPAVVNDDSNDRYEARYASTKFCRQCGVPKSLFGDDKAFVKHCEAQPHVAPRFI